MLRHHALFALGNFAGDAYFRHCVLDAGALPVVLAELERSSLAGGWKSENQDYRVDDYVRVCGTVEAGTLSAGSSLPSGAKAIVVARPETLPRFYDVRVPETGQTACVWANDMVHESEVTKHRCAGWLLLNLCRGRDQGAPLEQFNSALPVIARILRDATDVQLTSLRPRARELTANVPDEQLRGLDTGVAPRLLEILGVERLCVDAEVAGVRVQSRHRKACIDTTLQVVGNIVTGSEEQTQQLLDLGLLPRLHRILATPSDERLRRTNRTNHPRRINACWAVSNICAGTEEQRHAVWEAELFPQLASLLADDEAGADAAWAFANSWEFCSDVFARHLAEEVEPAVVPLLCSQLERPVRTPDVNDTTGHPVGLSALSARCHLCSWDVLQTRSCGARISTPNSST